jgi:hypothetical protein
MYVVLVFLRGNIIGLGGRPVIPYRFSFFGVSTTRDSEVRGQPRMQAELRWCLIIRLWRQGGRSSVLCFFTTAATYGGCIDDS